MTSVTDRERLPDPPRSSTGVPLLDALEFKRDPLAFTEELSNTYGEVAEFRLGAQRAMVVSGAQPIKEVLVARAKDFDKGDLQRAALVPVLRRGLLISEGALHDAQRKLVAPLFAQRTLGPYIEMIGARIERHILDWESLGEFELIDRLRRITHDVIAQLLIGGPMGEEDRLAEGVTRVFEWEMKRLFSPVPTPLWVPTARNRRLRRDLQELRERVAQFIAERRAHNWAGDDVLTSMIHSGSSDGRSTPDDLLVDETVSIWGAAHETSADAQFWAAYSMWRQPEVADAVREEVTGSLGERLPTFDDLSSLPYSLQVFKEAMRMYPPAALFLRQAVVDTEIGGYHVRKGTLIFLSTFAMHRSDRYYEDPLEFRPERFVFAEERTRDRYSYLPFGAGAHVCIGSSLALMEGQVFTALLASRGQLNLHVAGPVAPQLLINLRPRGTIRGTYCATTVAERTSQ
jgi:cytochrome P450